MYCNRCHSDTHYAAQCSQISPKVQREAEPKPEVSNVVKARLDDGADKEDVCPTCGTNLEARKRERDRRREYMKKYRERK